MSDMERSSPSLVWWADDFRKEFLKFVELRRFKRDPYTHWASYQTNKQANKQTKTGSGIFISQHQLFTHLFCSSNLM